MVFCVSIIGMVLACAGAGCLAEKRRWAVKHLIWFVPSALLVLVLIYPEHLVALRSKELSTVSVTAQAAEIKSEEEEILEWIDKDAEYYASVFSLKNLRKMGYEAGDEWETFAQLFKERYSAAPIPCPIGSQKTKVSRIASSGAKKLRYHVYELIYSGWVLGYYWFGWNCKSGDELTAVLKRTFPAFFPQGLPASLIMEDIKNSSPDFYRTCIEKTLK